MRTARSLNRFEGTGRSIAHQAPAPPRSCTGLRAAPAPTTIGCRSTSRSRRRSAYVRRPERPLVRGIRLLQCPIRGRRGRHRRGLVGTMARNGRGNSRRRVEDRRLSTEPPHRPPCRRKPTQPAHHAALLVRRRSVARLQPFPARPCSPTSCPRIDGKPIPPPIAHLSTSFYELNDSTEANVLPIWRRPRVWASRSSGSMPIGSRGLSRRHGPLRIPAGEGRADRPLSPRVATDQRRRPHRGHEVPGVVRAGAGRRGNVSGQGASRLGYRRGAKGGLFESRERSGARAYTTYLNAVIAVRDGLAADRLQHRPAAAIGSFSTRTRSRRHGRDSLHRRIVPNVGRSAGRLSAPGGSTTAPAAAGGSTWRPCPARCRSGEATTPATCST